MKKILTILICCLMLFSVPPLSLSATETPKTGLVSIGNSEAKRGSTFSIPLMLEKNPGIIALRLTLDFDPALLEFVSAEAGDFEGAVLSKPGSSSVTIVWEDALSESDNRETGKLAILSFRALDFAALGDSALTLRSGKDDILNADLDTVPMELRSGKVTILPESEGFSTGFVDTEHAAIGSGTTSAFLSTRRNDDGTTFDMRFVLVSKQGAVAVGDEFEITFRTESGSEICMSRTVAAMGSEGEELMFLYEEVNAAGITYTAVDGCVVYGVVVSGIPYHAFDQLRLRVKRDGETMVSGIRDYSLIEQSFTPQPVESAEPSEAVA